MKDSEQSHKQLETAYACRYNRVLIPLAARLHEYISELMEDQPRIDRVTVRAKSPGRFLGKAAMGSENGFKYSDPLAQIQDQMGARIVVFYRDDVQRVEKVVNRYFAAIENRQLIPETESEFGYFGHHLVLVLPTDVIDEDMDDSMVPSFFELQIKTLFQHAWSEADHDLGYKRGSVPLTSDQKRKIAFTSAQAWGADLIFDELFRKRGEGNTTECRPGSDRRGHDCM